MKKIKIALLGFGTVGQGVCRILSENKKEILLNCGYEIEIGRILVRDKNKKRNVKVPEEIITTDIKDILDDKDIKIVVELMGGSEPAFEYMLRAMKCKKHVVTANKLILATKGEELLDAAEKEGVLFYYEASVGGGIPIIRGIKESLTAEKIENIFGIINGTTNYILTKMTQEGTDFDDALKQAQTMGYAEADPTSDIEGYDAAYKLAIMASLCFGTKIDFKSIYREGICNIKAADVDYASKFGYVIKLLAIGKQVSDKLELRVHPAMVPRNHPIANVNDSFNAVFIKGNAVGDLMFYGRGAGDLPTGSAVVGDIISVLRNKNNMPEVNLVKRDMPSKQVQSNYENMSDNYIRLNVKNQPGVLEKITEILEENKISVQRIKFDIKNKDNVDLVFITYKTSEKSISQLIKSINEIDNVNKVENVIRIENFN